MSSRNAKRGRKDPPNSEIAAKETKPEVVAKETKPEDESNDATDNNTEVKVVKKSPGRPRKLESEKKKWVPTGRSRGRPRIHPVDHNKVKKPRGRPRTSPMVHKEKRPRGRPRKSSTEDGEDKKKKVTGRGQKRPGRPRKQ